MLQSGEDPYFTDERLSSLIGKIVSSYDVRITLSVGERSRESYERLYRAGARRYLLRHESITESHFSKLHPAGQGLSKRIKALMDLKDIGYQTGCGFMVGSPYQSAMDIARDLMFIKSFKPHMVGIGPFIAARNTPFENFESGSAELTLKLLAIIRIMNPKVLLPSTTALASIVENGDLLGLESGANVIMPNFTPLCVSGKYSIYDNKKRENTDSLKERLGRAGYSIPVTFGDSHVDA